ncbi:MAG: helix-turn-helix domain-containing protein [Thermomicrobiales bacterium]
MEEAAYKLGTRVRELRLARGWTQEQLAERAGIHEKFLGAVERGERNVTLRNIARIARGLNVPIMALFATEADTLR